MVPLRLLTETCAPMPFTTKNPTYYLESLAGTFASSLHIGLYLSGDVDDARASDYAALGKAIRKTKRPIRCLWLRFGPLARGGDGRLEAFRAFGDELSGATTAIQSLVIEGEEVRTDEVMCLLGMLEQNILCGIQFRRTSVDRSTFNELNPYFLAASHLKVVDLSCNNNIDDDCITDVLGALTTGRARIESFSICERNIEGGQSQADSARISGEGVAKIASFVYKTTSLKSLTLRLRNMDDVGIGELANVLKRSDGKVRRLELSGNYGNGGIKIFAEALKTNISLRTITFGSFKSLTNAGAMELLDVVDPFTKTKSRITEWRDINSSNNTLQSIFFLDRHSVSVDQDLVTRLQSITSEDPRLTFDTKVWKHLQKNLDDISHMKVSPKCLPGVLRFVGQRGTKSDFFRLIKGHKALAVLFSNPSQERQRLVEQMRVLWEENKKLRKLLMMERSMNASLQQENLRLRDAKENCAENVKQGSKFISLLHAWKMFLSILTEPNPATQVVSL